MLKSFKFGFTLAELLCVIAIIGICTALALTLKKAPEEKALKNLYVNAYSALDTAYYNSSEAGRFSELWSQVANGGADQGAKILCDGLTFYINTMDNSKTGSSDSDANCSASKLVSVSGNNLGAGNIQFTANNGMQFWISNKVSFDSNMEFYLVFVDVNGDKRPNSMRYTYKRANDPSTKVRPDRFAFAVLKNGRVCPIGIPEFDPIIMTARVAHPDTSATSETVYSGSYPYYQAKQKAWGCYTGSSDPTLDDAKNMYTNEDPFTANAYVKYAITAETDGNDEIYADFPADGLTSLDKESIASSWNCANNDWETCYIFIDRYRM